MYIVKNNKIVIPYIYNNTNKNYIPDFILSKTIIEIKSTYYLNKEITGYKIDALKNYVNKSDYYTNYIIYTEKDLPKFDILKDIEKGIVIIDSNKLKRLIKK